MNPQYDVELDRHEAKYIIHPSLVPRIREFIKPFCAPDHHGHGDPPEYVITTLQLDSPSLSLYHAKELDALNRFKLRIRTYGNAPTDLVFLEVKKKFRGCVQKSRASLPREVWREDLITNPRSAPWCFWSKKQESAYLEFIRLARLIGAQPVLLIRYTRESYFGTADHYARVTFDRHLMYQPTRRWDLSGAHGKWFNMDTSLAQDKDNRYSGVVLELKTLSDAPQWMMDVVMEFDLVRVGNCKYSMALGLESLFRGSPQVPLYATELLSH